MAAILLLALLLAVFDYNRATTMAAIAVALAVTILPCAAAGTGRFAAFSRAFGDASYSIYLTHTFLLGAFASLTASVAILGLPALGAMALLACLLCGIAGWLTWRWVELPIARRIRGRRPSEVELTAP